MGILDDAIREHLELKRQHGAEPDDVARLEKEAFGPATRPGDEADYDPGDVDLDPAGEAPTELVEAEPPQTDAPPEAPLSEQELERSTEPETDPGSAAFFDHLEEDPFAEIGEPPEDPGEAPAQRARTEHSYLQDTIDHPVVGADEPDAPSEPPESEIFDSGSDEEELPLDEIDLELDVDPVGSAPVETPADRSEPAPAASADPSIESEEEAFEPDFGSDELDLSLGDETFEEPLSEPGTDSAAPPDAAPPSTPEPSAEEAAPLPEPPAQEAPPTPEPDLPDASEPVPEEEEEDLLEETPEFLESAPEGERLWFEQGEPKDFDF
ncbi:MAG: hypothetical protein ACR2K6_09740 [Solirubrobacterales bacterium]